MPVNLHGLCNLCPHSLHSLPAELIRQRASHDHRKLIPAETECMVGASDTPKKPSRHLNQHLVSHHMPVPIIDRLKQIQIHIKQRVRRFLLILDVQQRFEIPFVEQARQRIGIGKILQLMSNADILRRQKDRMKSAILKCKRNHVHEHEHRPVSCTVFKGKRILPVGKQLRKMLRGQHIRDLCQIIARHGCIPSGNALNQLFIAPGFRIQRISLHFPVLVGSFFQITDGKPVYHLRNSG